MRNLLTALVTSATLLLAQSYAAAANPAADGRILYVRQGASGARDGSSWANAFSELQWALREAESGDEVWVAAGVYKPNDFGSLPASCQAVRQAHPGAGDGYYWIGPNGNAFEAYCHDMAGTPREYVDVPQDSNRFDLQTALLTTRYKLTSSYSKVRVDPGNLLVDIADPTFQVANGAAYYENTWITSVPYAVAGSCTGLGAEGRVSLSGTPFTVDAGTFRLTGYDQGGHIEQESAQSVSFLVTGFCAWVYPGPQEPQWRTPRPSAWNLQLVYAPEMWSFELKPGVEVYGGFGGHEALREQRDWMHNPTVLSGDLAGDDAAVGGVVTTVDDIVGRNSRRVVEGSNDASSVLDGFTITAGDGHDCAGMAAGPMQLANLAFSGNRSAIYAGGLCLGGSASLSNVLFTGNRAERGGGLVVEHSSPTLSNVTFEDNVATHEGGGAYIYGMGTVRIVEAILARNSAEQRGGGLAIDTLSQVILDRVTYTENDASRGGGISVVDSKLTLRNVAISDNTAQQDGGGLYVSGGSIDAANLLVVGNTAQRDGGGIANLDSQVGMVNATIAYNKAPTGKGGGIANLGAKSTPLKNTIVWGNEAATDAQIHDATPPGSGGEYECLVQDRYRNCRKGAADRPPFRREGRQAALADPKFSLQPANEAVDNGATKHLPQDVTGDLRSSARVWSDEDLDGANDVPGTGVITDTRKVDLGAFEAQGGYTWYMAFGLERLSKGREYRTGYHALASPKTIGDTIPLYDHQVLANSLRSFDMAGESPDVDESERTAAVRGLLEASWEVATGEMLLGNQDIIEAIDPRPTGAMPAMTAQLSKLQAARGHFARAADVYRTVFGGANADRALELQPERTVVTDTITSAPYADVERLAQAAAKLSGAYSEIAERQFRRKAAGETAAPEGTMRQGFDVAATDLVLLRRLGRGWECNGDVLGADACLTRYSYLAAIGEIEHSLSSMVRRFGYLVGGRNPFGYGPDYLPFRIPYDNDRNPEAVSNFRYVLDLAYRDDGSTSDWSRANDSYGRLMAVQRDLDDHEAKLADALVAIDDATEERLVEICGRAGIQPDVAACGNSDGNGDLYKQLLRVDSARKEVTRVQVRMANQLALIRIEQERAARVAGFHRATAVMYDQTGKELASLARQEAELEAAEEATGSFLDGIGSAIEGIATGNPLDAVDAVVSIGKGITQAVAGAEKADIAEKRAQIEAYQNSYVKYADADIEDANSEAEVRKLMLAFKELDLDLVTRSNDLLQELAHLERLKTEFDYLLARRTQARREAYQTFGDPAQRVLRDSLAGRYQTDFDRALESTFLAGRALDYEWAQKWAGEDGVYSMVGVTDLLIHLQDMDDKHDKKTYGAQVVEYDRVSVARAMGFVDSDEVIDDRVVRTTAREKFQRYASDPANWVDLHPPGGGDGEPESLRLVFGTTIFDQTPPGGDPAAHNMFSLGRHNDKILRVGAVLWGDAMALDGADNGTSLRLQQSGACFLRTDRAWGPNAALPFADDFRAYAFSLGQRGGPFESDPGRQVPSTAIVTTDWLNLQKPTPQQIDESGSLGLLWRSVGCTEWVLTIAKKADAKNDDIDFAALEDIDLWVKHRSFVLDMGMASAQGRAVGRAATVAVTAASRAQAPAQAPAGSARDYVYVGTLVGEDPVGLPQAQLVIRLEEAGGVVEGSLETGNTVAYPHDDSTSQAPTVRASAASGQLVLASDPFDGASGRGTHTLTLTVTNTESLDAALMGRFVERIVGAAAWPLEVSGTFSLVQTGARPQAAFSAVPASGPVPLPVHFLDWSTGAPTSWHWTFGDGQSSDEPNPEHTYAAAGTYDVTLTVSNTFGAATKTSLGHIEAAAAGPPVARFSADVREVFVGREVSFRDLSAGSPTTWSWNFGDGSTSTERNPTHAYTEVGAHDVSLEVSNAFGSDVRTETGFIVVKPLDADFSAEPTSGLAPLEVTFTDRSLGEPTGWLWHFGDGQTSDRRHPTHTYADPGEYAVTLTVAKGTVSDTEQKPGFISVSAPAGPVAAFTASPRSGRAPLTVTFTDRSTGAPTSWSWEFGDGAASSDRNPTHTYMHPGVYTVALTAGNQWGTSTKTMRDHITVTSRTGARIHLPVAMKRHAAAEAPH